MNRGISRAELSTGMTLPYVSVGPSSATPVIVSVPAWKSPDGPSIDSCRYSPTRSTLWQWTNEATALGHDDGDDVDEGGPAVAALHRGWISLKDALTGDDAGGVLAAALTGEDHTVSEYERVLEQGLSAGFWEVVSRQHAEVVAARGEVKALQTAG